MRNRRRRRGFERAGALPLDRLGLPGNRARELILADAWERVAGPALAAHARALRVQRGVLEIEVDCGRWSANLAEILPALAGSLSRACPELGVRKFRLVRLDSNEKEAARPVEAPEQPPAAEDPPPPPRTEQIEVEDLRPQEARLEDLAQRYLERGEDQNQ